MHDLTGKTILVTGATSGIGRATALHCAAAGAHVVASGRRVELGESLEAQTRALGQELTFVPADVTVEADVRRMVETCVDTYGALHCAFNNAGLFVREVSLHEHDEDMWQQHLSVGLTGVYRCMKYEIQHMLKLETHCAIVNNASVVGLRGSLSSGAGYTAAAHGVVGLTRQAAIEYANTSIRINALCPGPALTEATAPYIEARGSEQEAHLATLNPTAKLVPMEELAATVAFLCSEQATMINGHTLPLDGGQLARL